MPNILQNTILTTNPKVQVLTTGCIDASTLLKKEIIKLFPARESLVSDIPAEDAKMVNLFLQLILSASSVTCRTW
jgi:hypothetical protein